MEPTYRLIAFLSVFAVMAIAELLAPRRVLRTSKGWRWLANLGVVALDTILVRLLFPAAAVGMAVNAQEWGWGLFNAVPWPGWLEIVLAIAILDFVIYFQHVVFHAVPTLWRLHMVHHADNDIDVTTGLRFHPIEILLSMGIKIAAVTALGPAPLAVFLFEVILNASSMFNHSNVRLGTVLDRVLRLFVVTPDMHRVHHSVKSRETNTNFGFNFPWWDWLFGTYTAQPSEGHEGMTIGLEQFQERGRESLRWMLWLPFRGKVGKYPVNRRGS